MKTLIVRDPKIILFESLAFELVEYSLRDVLNNFKECWWDHAIVDFLGCNMVGIFLGFWVIDKFKMERYKWSFRDAPLQTSTWTQVKYFFSNWDLSQLEVKSFSGIKKYLQMSWFCLFVHFFLTQFQLNDLSVFFVKYVYQIPPSNYMVTLRVLVVGLLCVNAAKEFYKYLIRRENNLKVNCFMVHMIVLTEVFLVYKHGKHDFSHASVPTLGWVFLSSLFALFMIILVKVLISEIINFRKGSISKKQICSVQKEPAKQPSIPLYAENNKVKNL